MRLSHSKREIVLEVSIGTSLCKQLNALSNCHQQKTTRFYTTMFWPKRLSGFRCGSERHFNFAHFHFSDVGTQLDSRLRNLGLKRLGLGFNVRLVRVVPDP